MCSSWWDTDEMRWVFALDQCSSGAVRLVADRKVEGGHSVYFLCLFDYRARLVSGKDDG